MPADLDSLSAQTISKSTLTDAQIHEQAAALGPRWSIDGNDLKLELKGPVGMARAGAAVAHATQIADEMNHHPTIHMEYPGTTLKIHTHDKNAITMIDFIWAARLEGWLRRNGW
ncbi:MAG TPA: 4a-hydroxytetrahydrobiopterin dehydratase [Kofleriaceae bacterium]|jgi:4a-hydroxytetrahydrobiopterin dehydratase